MCTVFDNLLGKDKRSAVALLNGYNRQIAAWQRDADQLKGVGSVDLKDYIGYTDLETNEYTSLSDFRLSLEARRKSIDDRVTRQREYMRIRNREESQAARVRRAISGKTSTRQGRPKEHLLKYGQYVYFAVAYNHGQGAFFLGYDVDEKGDFGPTAIEEW